LIQTAALVFAPLAVLGIVLPGSAADLNYDGVDDSVVISPHEASVGPATVGIVNVGEVNDYLPWLTQLGYSYSLIPVDSNYAILSQYALVLLPATHGQEQGYDFLAKRSGDYHQYVNDGGCLYVGQPNPYQQPPAIPWVPYLLELDAVYSSNPCSRYITDPYHCMTAGLFAGDLPQAYDTVLALGPEWEVLVRETGTEKPCLFTSHYGAGHVVVDLGSPGLLFCAYTIDGFQRMIECCLSPLEGGACCFANGTCVDDLKWPDCVSAGGVFHPGETCETAQCAPIVPDPFTWTISASANDPDANATSYVPGLQHSYLWLKCCPGSGVGIVGAEFSLFWTDPANVMINLITYNGFTFQGYPNDLVFSAVGCPCGPILVGELTSYVSAPGSLCFGPVQSGAQFTRDCFQISHVMSWTGLAYGGVPCSNGVLCGPVSVNPSSWGRIKGLYRE